MDYEHTVYTLYVQSIYVITLIGLCDLALNLDIFLHTQQD